MFYEIYHDTYSSAIAEICKKITYKNLIFNEDEFFSVISCDGKPRPGETKRASLSLYNKDGVKNKKNIHFQVYNRETDRKSYELNMYIL